MLIWVIFVLLAIFLGLGYYVIHLAVTGRRYTQESLAAQLDKPAYREIRETSLASTGWVASHAHEELHVMSYDGKLLHATFLPKEHAKGTILLFHGYKSCWQIDFGLVLPYYYDTLGYSLLLVDQRAHGLSQGKYLTFGVRERMDVISWATYMGQKLGQDAPLILGGLSMGATTVLMASCFDFPANVRAIIADCGFTSPYEIAKSVLHRDYPRLPVGLLLPICGLFTRLYAGFGLHDASTLDAVRDFVHPRHGRYICPLRDDERGLCRLHVRKRADLSGQRRAWKELSGGKRPRGRGALPLSCDAYRVKGGIPHDAA